MQHFLRDLQTLLPIFIAGVVGLGIELSLLREASFVLGPLADTNALVISGYLVGLALGSLCGGSQQNADVPTIRFARPLLGWSFFLTLYLVVRDSILYEVEKESQVQIFFFLFPAVMGFFSGRFFALSLFLPFRNSQISPTTSYGANTLGSVVGGLLHGLLLVPLFGLDLLYFGMLALVSLSMLLLVGFHRYTLFSICLLMASYVFLATDHAAEKNGVLYSKDSSCGLVQVQRETKPAASVDRVYIDGIFQASSSESNKKMHREWEPLTRRVTPNAKRVLMFGLGSGVSAEAFLERENINSLDIVEGCEPMVEVSERFFPETYSRVVNDPRMHISFEDFRRFLRFSRDQWDIILVDHSLVEPIRQGYFTKEFFVLLASRLRTGGVVAMSFLYPDVLPTSASVFPHIYEVTDTNLDPRIRRNSLFFMMTALPEEQGYFVPVNRSNLIGGPFYRDDRVFAGNLSSRFDIQRR